MFEDRGLHYMRKFSALVLFCMFVVATVQAQQQNTYYVFNRKTLEIAHDNPVHAKKNSNERKSSNNYNRTNKSKNYSLNANKTIVVRVGQSCPALRWRPLWP